MKSLAGKVLNMKPAPGKVFKCETVHGECSTCQKVLTLNNTLVPEIITPQLSDDYCIEVSFGAAY